MPGSPENCCDRYFPPPDTRRLLELSTYYRRFVNTFSRIANALAYLTKATVGLKWQSRSSRHFKNGKHVWKWRQYSRTSTKKSIPKCTPTQAGQGSAPSLCRGPTDLRRLSVTLVGHSRRRKRIVPPQEKNSFAIIWASEKSRHHLYGDHSRS